jgi:hypothetical protein
LKAKENMRVGWIASEKTHLSSIALDYISELKRLIYEHGYTVL